MVNKYRPKGAPSAPSPAKPVQTATTPDDPAAASRIGTRRTPARATLSATALKRCAPVPVMPPEMNPWPSASFVSGYLASWVLASPAELWEITPSN